MIHRIQRIRSLDFIVQNYRAIFSDIWGVLHDGINVFFPSVSALSDARKAGVPVILLTNAPQPSSMVIEELERLSVPSDAWDCIITSGDVTRSLLSDFGKKVFHIGPQSDLAFYKGLDVELVDEKNAQTIVCTGLVEPKADKPENYTNLLKQFCERNIPFICANPDVHVRQGKKMIWCAGALASDYEALGGTVLRAGKPYKPAYDLAYKKATEILGVQPERSQILAIGDNMLTDVRGALENGFPMLYVSNGVHTDDYTLSNSIDEQLLDKFLSLYEYKPTFIIHGLK